MSELSFDHNSIPRIRNLIFQRIGKYPLKIEISKHGDVKIRFAQKLTEAEISQVENAMLAFNANLKRREG